MTKLNLKSDDEDELIKAGLRLVEAVYRCRALGWRTVTVDRLVRLTNGDDTRAMPPDPMTAPKSVRGTHYS